MVCLCERRLNFNSRSYEREILRIQNLDILFFVRHYSYILKLTVGMIKEKANWLITIAFFAWGYSGNFW